MRDRGRHAGEVTHDEGYQVGGHGGGGSKVGGGQACGQALRGKHRHVGESSQACGGGEADGKGGLHSMA